MEHAAIVKTSFYATQLKQRAAGSLISNASVLNVLFLSFRNVVECLMDMQVKP